MVETRGSTVSTYISHISGFDKRAVVLIQTSIMSSEETLLSFEFCLSAFKRHIGELVSFI